MLDYAPLLIPLIVGMAAQVVKLAVDKIKGNLNLKNMWLSYGGLPSAHTAFAVSATTMAGATQGWYSPLFAVALTFTLIIMRDAVTFRNYLGHQGKLLNQLMERLPPEERKTIPHFQERVGHTIGEVAAGAVFGIILTLALDAVGVRLFA